MKKKKSRSSSSRRRRSPRRRPKHNPVEHAMLQHFAFALLFVGLGTLKHGGEVDDVIGMTLAGCASAVLYFATARLILWLSRLD